MTKIGFHARITNPLTLGYYAYLACFDSWRKIVDHVVVVDGGSSDSSVETLRTWLHYDSKLEVINNDTSHWGSDFAWEQSTLNMQLGHQALDACDWIIRADADHVVDVNSASQLLAELEARFSGSLTVAFDVFYFWNGKYHQRKPARNWIVNNRLAKRLGVRIGWGRDIDRNLLVDDPLSIEYETSFVDPETAIVKPILHGRPLVMGPTCSLRVYRYGHFFFTRQQAIDKCRIWDNAVAKLTGSSRQSDFEIKVNADTLGIIGHMTKQELVTGNHPPELVRLFPGYYRAEMLGTALYFPGTRTVLRSLVKSYRVINKSLKKGFSLSHLKR